MMKHLLVLMLTSIVPLTVSCSNSAGTNDGTGGATATGGSAPVDTGGSANTGGSAATGGTQETGGTTSTGGKQDTGGTTATGGMASTGGLASTGGMAGTGGQGDPASTGGGQTTATGGAATGGAPTTRTGGTGTGGVAGAGGTIVTGGTTTTGTGGTTPGAKSSGCGKNPTLTSGSKTIQSGGQSRSYIIRIPSGYDNTNPYRLVFAFHWNGGTMGDIDGGGTSGATWSYYGLQAQANGSTIFVAPQGIGNGWANSGGRDLTLVDDLLKLIQGDLCIDTTRIFSMGFSYGGGMTYELACARGKVFRAAAVYSGAQLSGCDGGNDPIAYIGVHGVSDGTCGISGGRSLRDRFVKNNGCTAQSPPEPSNGSKTHICTTYTGCKAGYPVEWCAFDGGHTPGNVDGGGDDGAKTWTKTEVWKFFSQF
jgi:poly(3-hydroxybutyrate) depolymerase